jgi:hypothetical protein
VAGYSPPRYAAFLSRRRHQLFRIAPFVSEQNSTIHLKTTNQIVVKYLFAHLLADSGVSAYVSTRIYPGACLLGSSLPAIVLTRIIDSTQDKVRNIEWQVFERCFINGKRNSAGPAGSLCAPAPPIVIDIAACTAEDCFVELKAALSY